MREISVYPADIANALLKDFNSLEPEKEWRIKPHPESWDETTKRRSINIVNDSEEGIHFYVDYQKPDRFRISVNWPKSRDGKDDLSPHRPYAHTGQWFAITLKAGDTPKDIRRIVAAIYSRLMPEYREKLQEILKIRDEHNEAFDGRDAIAGQLYCILNQSDHVRMKAGEKESDNVEIFAGSYNNEWLGIDCCDFDISPYRKNDITLKLSTSNHSLILALAKVIGTHIEVAKETKQKVEWQSYTSKENKKECNRTILQAVCTAKFKN